MTPIEEADRWLARASEPHDVLVSERQVAATIAVAHLLREIVDSLSTPKVEVK